jgi:hypothetical protein
MIKEDFLKERRKPMRDVWLGYERICITQKNPYYQIQQFCFRSCDYADYIRRLFYDV